jgi:hypothetical protein
MEGEYPRFKNHRISRKSLLRRSSWDQRSSISYFDTAAITTATASPSC